MAFLKGKVKSFEGMGSYSAFYIDKKRYNDIISYINEYRDNAKSIYGIVDRGQINNLYDRM